MRRGNLAIVIGLGAVGSAALHYLAARGAKVLGLDRYAPPHDCGSSHGETRMTRVALGEGPEFIPLVRRSHELWRELEAATGRQLLHQIGGLIFGTSSHMAETHGAPDFLGTTRAMARAHGIPHEMLDAPAIAERFPQFRLRGGEIGYFEPEAGYLAPEACILAHLEEARRLDANIRTGETVIRWESRGRTVRVVTDRATYEASRLILTAGPWLPHFLDILPRRTAVFRQTTFWFEPDGPVEDFQADRLPVFVRLPDADSNMFYGFPVVDSSTGGIKVASEQFERTCTPDSMERGVTDTEIAAMHRMVAPHLRITNRCLRALACPYTVTPNFRFIIDHLPDAENIWFASACSGHGFKHSPAIGEALADLATTGRSNVGVSSFSLRR